VPGTAVIVGVGTGFGYSLARKLASHGFDIALLSRNADRLRLLCEELRRLGVQAHSYGLDATHETDVKDTFARVVQRHGAPSMVVYSLQEFGPGAALEVSVPAFESAWRHNCLGAFLVSQEAARAMVPLGKGSIFLVGSTSSIIGRAGHLNLAVGKFGQRALAQVLSRELWSVGIHVAHVLIDADIRRPDVESTEDVQSDPNDIAVSILALHNQPRSAWSSEIDIRPWNERFWEHC
jgi:NAD(P)-dependent dehydrogenase (short-subunit alcohol dehydrogenase family)